HLARSGRDHHTVSLPRLDRDAEMLAIPVRQSLRIAGLEEHATDTLHLLHETLLPGMVNPVPVATVATAVRPHFMPCILPRQGRWPKTNSARCLRSVPSSQTATSLAGRVPWSCERSRHRR